MEPRTAAEVPQIEPVSGCRPHWSVIIPVHDCADYLAAALPEVLAQLGDRDDAEIVVVDDQSSDGPGRVVDRLGRGRVAYRPNPGHLGAIGTFNRGLELSRGELVHLLHGDDLVLPGFYAAMESALTDPATAVAVCRVEDVDAAGNPLYRTRSYRSGTGVWQHALTDLAVTNRVRAPGIVVRRRAYEAVGGYRGDLPHAADWEMWTRLAAYGPVIFVDRVLARYRRHAGSDTSHRVRTGANLRERVSAISVIAHHVPAPQRAWVTRRALAYAGVFAARSTLRSVRQRDWTAAAAQLRETLRCLALLPVGVPRST